MLSVSSRPKRRALTSERAFEARIAAELKARGIYSRHMADRFSGLPDRYIAGGRWVEFKSLRAPKEFNFQGLSDPQKAEMTRLADAGDRVWYCALFTQEDGAKYVKLVRWVRDIVDECDFAYPFHINDIIYCIIDAT